MLSKEAGELPGDITHVKQLGNKHWFQEQQLLLKHIVYYDYAQRRIELANVHTVK